MPTRNQEVFRLVELKIEVTYRCVLRCVHCSSEGAPDAAAEMHEQDCLRIIDQAAEIGVTDLALSGGEPILWPSVHRAVEAAKSRGMNVAVYSSGVGPKATYTIASFASAGLDRMALSLFGSNPTIHENITRRRGSFAATIASAKAAKGGGIETEIHFVPLRRNFRDLTAVARLASDLGASRLSVLRFVPQGRGRILTREVLTHSEFLELRTQIQSLRKQGFEIRTGSPFNFLMLRNQPECNAACDRLTIRPDLRIVPCDGFKQVYAEDVVGTLDHSSLAANSLSDCWEKSPYLAEVRRYLRTPFPTVCQSCDSLSRCNSGCLAQKVIVNRKFLKTLDPACLRYRSETPDQIREHVSVQ